MSLKSITLEDLGEHIGTKGQSELYECPNCGHKVHVNLELGLLNCFFCGFGKGLILKGYSNTNLVKREYNKFLPEFTNKLLPHLSLLPYERKFVEGKGILDPSRFNICSIPTDIRTILKDVFGDEIYNYNILSKTGGLPAVLKPGRVFIPYYGFKSKPSLVSFKTRSTPYLDAVAGDYDSIRYLAPKDSIHYNYLYKPTKIPKTDSVIITEGEFKTIVCNQFNYPCLGLPGIGIAKPLENIILKLAEQVSYLYLILDSDQNTFNFSGAIKQYIKFGKVLNIIPVLLPLEGSTKMGLDDYLLSHSLQDFDELLEEFRMKKQHYMKSFEETYAPNPRRD